MLSSLFALTFLASIPMLLIGLVNPRWVTPRSIKNPSRKLTLSFYSSTAIASVLLMFAFDAGVSGSPDAVTVATAVPTVESVGTPSIDTTKAVDVLTYAYLTYANPNSELGSVGCTHREMQQRHFVFCEFGQHQSDQRLHHKGLWEVQASGDELLFLAINGSALEALERMPAVTDMKKHPEPMQIDIPAAMAAFQGER